MYACSKQANHIDDYIKQFGHFGLAKSTSQWVCDAFYAHNGCISYLKRSHFLFFKAKALILAQPLCAKENIKDLLTAFFTKHPSPIFVQIQQSLATVLQKEFGYQLIPFGMEHHIDLKTFQYNWRLRPNLVRYKNKFKALGYTIKEAEFNATYKKKCKDISDQWLQTKHHKKEQQFLTRPLRYQAEEDVRLFTLEKNQDMAGFIVLDPIYKSNEVIGYMVNHMRYLPSTPKGSMYALLAHIIDQLKIEQKDTLNLGVAPFHKQDIQHLNSSCITTLLSFLYSQNKIIYNFKGLEQMKSSFKATKKMTYIAVKSTVPILDCIHIYQSFFKYQ
jgi:lysylphosphatidylglycerol synthetase-like protein (DUF2156 family)